MNQPIVTPPSNALKRYVPVIAIAVVAALVLALLLWPKDKSSSSPDTTGAATTVPTGSTTPATDANGSVTVDTSAPFFFDEAKAAGIEGTIDWTDRCDTKVGRYAYPSPYAMPCIAPFKGDNGGATAKGVTGDAIKIVVYQAQENDPIIQFIAGQVKNNDTNAQQADTIQKISGMFGHFAELYGRKLQFEFYTATGVANDEVAAKADATAIAEKQPFAVWGSPAFAGKPFAEELAAQKVLCLCTGGGDAKFVQERAPYLVTLVPSVMQGTIHLAEFVGKRLVGGKAQYSGDFVNVDRKIGLVYISTSAESQTQAETLQKLVKDKYQGDIVDLVPYTIDPATLQEQAATIIARLKTEGVTTIIFVGDPVAPISLTKEATAQSYFPEWIVGGAGYTETTAFARTYDQAQWKHAFGVCWYPAPVALDKAGPYRRYTWYYGQDPAARDSVNDLENNAAFLYYFLQAAGPNLTPQSFIDAMFNTAQNPSDPLTAVRLSWGTKGRWPAELEPDYYGVDDQTEIWWDAAATGQDELGRDGTGMYRWVAGGKRYYPGERPNDAGAFFVQAGSIDRYQDLPKGEELPDYPRPTNT